MNTNTEENYLKAILKLSSDNRSVSTNEISYEMETKASSVTDMIKKLADKKLVNYKPYQGVTLTPSGNKIAINILRKHRLWEVFLVEHLNFKWDEIHDIAEQLEHIISDELIERLDQFLNFPKHDPHGDPIPDAQGNMAVVKEIPLIEMEQGNHGVIVGVKDSSNEFLKYLDSIGVNLGVHVTVLNKYPYDQSMKIKINNKKQMMVSSQVAKNLNINEN